MPTNKRHVDVTQLTEEECSKIIDVISKDILLRKSEKERVMYLNKNFEDFRKNVMLANSCRKKRIPFDDYCLVCGKHLFTFFCLLNLGEECVACEHWCCSSCRKLLVVDQGNGWQDQYYICKLCLAKRECKRKTMEWFNELAEKRFKRFGSAKVLRATYKQNSTIEPRVITLLAHCRELQPTRTIAISSLRKQFSVTYSKDDDKSITQSSSYSNGFTFVTTKTPDALTHKRVYSESELTRLSEKQVRPRSQSASGTVKYVKHNVQIKNVNNTGGNDVDTHTGAYDKGDNHVITNSEDASCCLDCEKNLPKVNIVKKDAHCKTLKQRLKCPEKIQGPITENKGEEEELQGIVSSGRFGNLT